MDLARSRVKTTGGTIDTWPALSVGQRALWFEQQLQPAGNSYNLGFCLRFPAGIAEARLEAALYQLAARHVLLRSRVEERDGEPGIRIDEAPHPSRAPADAGDAVTAAAWVGRELLRPYALSREAPLRLLHAPLDDGGVLVALGCHHIIADLRSLAILGRELDATLSGAPLPDAEAAAEYAAFCEWQAGHLRGAAAARDLSFWRASLAAARAPERQPDGDVHGADALLDIDSATSAAVLAFARELGVTPYAVLLSAFQQLLARHGDGVVVGTPFSGRTEARFRNTVGYFVNLLPLVQQFSGAASFREAVTATARGLKASIRHGHYPFAALVEHLAPPRQPHGPPWLHAGFTYQRLPAGFNDDIARLTLGLPDARLRIAGQDASSVALPAAGMQFPLELEIAPVRRGFLGRLRSAAAAHQPERLVHDFIAGLQAGLASPDARRGSRATASAAAASGTLTAQVERSLERWADRLALSGAERLSYRELNRRASALAAALEAAQLPPQARVAVLGEGSGDCVVAMLGILKHGAAFVPLDATLGEPALRERLRLAQVSAVVQCGPPAPADWGLPLLRVPAEGIEPVVPCAPEPLAPAYLMFTSGTTGEPKAAVVAQEGAADHALAIAERMQIQPQDTVLLFASLSFDEHLEEIFPALVAGATLCCVPGIRFQEPRRLLRQVEARAISVLHLPTSYWHLWVDELRHGDLPLPRCLRAVNAGGEAASLERLRLWQAQVPRTLRWFNSYGLTEAAVTSLVYEFDGRLPEGGDGVPVGTPIGASRARVVDAAGEDVAAGATGELWLGGPGVGLGYFNRPEATAARFSHDAQGLRWLRTGDLARQLPDGNYVVLGRTDRLVKVRGERVDIADVESRINAHPAVAETVVAALGAAGDTRLVAHVARRRGMALTEAELRDWLLERLPAGQRPGLILFHPAIPRTPGLKPDFAALGRALPAPAAAGAATLDPAHAAIGGIFARLLGHAAGASDNFFAAGGHSLLAMRLVAALRRELRLELSIADFMLRPTIAGVAEAARSLPAEADAAESGQGPYPASAAQQRAALLGDDAASPRLQAAFRLDGAIDTARLRQAWRAVIDRHELLGSALRDGVVTSGIVSDAGELPLIHVAGTLPAGDVPELWQHFADGTAAPLRGRLLLAEDGGRVLLVQACYWALDGGGAAVLAADLARALGGEPLPPPQFPYRRFAQAERRWLASPEARAAEAFWRRTLSSAPPPTRLPMLRELEAPVAATRIEALVPGRGLQERLDRAVQTLGCSRFTCVLSALILLLARYNRADDLVIGVPVSLREKFGGADTVGPTLNPIALRVRLGGADTFADLAARVGAALADAQTHAALPWERIARAAELGWLAPGRPLPIQVVSQDAADATPDTLPLTPLAARRGSGVVPLLFAVETGARYRIELEFQSEALSTADARRLLGALREILHGVAQDPAAPLHRYGLVGTQRARARLAWQPLPADDADERLHSGIERHARATPGRIAVSQGGQWLSYAQLNGRSNALARCLLDAGLVPGEPVAIVSPKGLAEVIAALAVLKAGGAYAPIPPELPPQRQLELFGRLGARLALRGADAPCALPCPTIEVTPEGTLLEQDVGAVTAATDLAYLLFTSGSTGRPKGVRISHGAALSTLRAMQAELALEREDVLLGVAALGFDLSVFDLFGAFRVGARLLLPDAARAADPQHWAGCVREGRATVWNSVPMALDMLLDAAGAGGLPSLRRLLVSGDWVWPELARRARRECPQAQFIALGGATEASIWSNRQLVTQIDPRWRSVPYGRALPGHSLAVLDEAGWPLPAGVPGEIVIGGQALALGYHGDPVLTARRFRRHPLSGERCYWTGDLGRYLADGSIEILGRIDGQSKVRGYRVDLGEIEAALLAVPGVRQAAVAVLDDAMGLAAWFVADDGHEVTPETLRRRLGRRLPAYMVPLRYRRLERLPLTANGKLDRKALPPIEAVPAPAHRAPQSELEQQLLAIWQQLLPGVAIGVEDDFFQLGGHSLLATRLAARVQRELGRTVPLAHWLQAPTIATMAGALSGAADAGGPVPIASLRRYVDEDQAVAVGAPRTGPVRDILLTGGAGFVGSRLLRELLQHSEATIHCLVRHAGAPAAERIAAILRREGCDSPRLRRRVRVIEGELASPRLGLADRDWERLGASLDVVVHAGANVNLIQSYAALAPENVAATRGVVALAAAAGARLHYVSSVGVLPYGAGRRIGERDAIDVDGVLITGYCQSKWVAEHSVRNAMALGLRATISRPGLTIAARPADASFNTLECLLTITRVTGALPAVDFQVDLVGVDYVAAAIRDLALRSGVDGRTYHLTHPRPAAALELARRAGVQLLPPEAWLERLRQTLWRLDARDAALAATLLKLPFAELVPAAVDCTDAVAALHDSGIACPDVEALLTPYLVRLRS
jgi:amino acid adenylation domain-containing protein/thioester reductase-like protein